MSYLKPIEYRIIPKKPFQIIRNCSGCGTKAIYESTGNFRVNANGNQLDVWLIYQCTKCKHTYNLPIYERVKPSDIEPKLYQKFLKNDEDTAFRYGLRKDVFIQNKAEIIWDDMEYEIQFVETTKSKTYNQDPSEMEWRIDDTGREEKKVIIHNPFTLKVREDKLAAEILSISRSNAKKMIKNGQLQIQKMDGILIVSSFTSIAC